MGCRYAGRAVDTINAHNVSAGPLFYYLALQCAHDPMEVPCRLTPLPFYSTKMGRAFGAYVCCHVQPGYGAPKHVKTILRPQ